MHSLRKKTTAYTTPHSHCNEEVETSPRLESSIVASLIVFTTLPPTNSSEDREIARFFESLLPTIDGFFYDQVHCRNLRLNTLRIRLPHRKIFNSAKAKTSDTTHSCFTACTAFNWLENSYDSEGQFKKNRSSCRSELKTMGIIASAVATVRDDFFRFLWVVVHVG